MGCDGIWETKTNEEMVDFVKEKLNKWKGSKQKKGVNLKEVVSEILNDIISPDYVQTQGIGCDNMTLIIILFKRYEDLLV
jgi:protein phosphatase 1G